MSLKRALLAIALLGVSVSHSYAQSPKNEVPRLITYQAQVLGKDGRIVSDGEHAITAKLYADKDGDQLIWGDTYLIQSSGGIINLMLGSGDNVLPSSQQLSRALYLGVSIDGSEEMRPLQPFSAVPYALNVADNSITASKLATDYVSSFSINGKQITGRGGKVDLYAGNGVKLAYDSISNQLMIMGSRTTSTKGEPEVLTVSVYAKADIVVDGNATLNVDSGKTDIRGDVLLGGSSAKTITFKAKAASDLDMNAYSLNNADTVGIGKLSTVPGVLQMVSKNKTNTIRIMSDTLAGNRNYSIPDVGGDAKFVMNTTAQILDSLTMGKMNYKQGKIKFISQDLGHAVTIKADSTAQDRIYTIPDVGENSRFLMTSGLQTIDTILFTNIMMPSNDNSYALGDPGLRYRDIYMGPGSLHLIAGVDDGVATDIDYATQIDVNQGAGNGDLVFRESGNDLFRVSDVGDMTVTGGTTTDGVTTSGDIQPVDDNFVKIGSEESRIADIYLGPGSLHLIAGIDDGVTEDVDYAQQVDVSSTDGNGDLVFRESGDDLLRIAQSGDVTVTGSTTTAGMTTSGDIQPVDDNSVKIGSEQSRIADIFLGPGSLHLIAGVDDGVTEDVDYAQQVDVAGGAGNGDLVFRESGADLLRIAPTGDVTVMGNTTTGGVVTSGNITPTTDNTVQIGSTDSRVADIYLGPGSLHLIAGVDDGVTEEKDYAQQVDVTDGAGNGDLVFRESGADLLRIAPTGDVTVMGSTTTGGVVTSGNITPTTDNSVQIGSTDSRVADIYLGPGSLHLIAGVDDGVTEEKDYAQQVDVAVGAGNGDLVFRESGTDLLRLAPTGDVTVTGSTTTGGVVTSGDVVPSTDNTVTLGSTDSRYMDIFVGPGSIHVSGTSAELDGATSRDWVLDLLQSGSNAGNFQLMEGGNLAMSMTPTGNAAITGKVTSAATLAGDAATTLTTKGYVDNVGAANWSLSGNAGLTASNYIGTSDAAPFVVKTNGAERMRILSTGAIGIGNPNPLTALDVVGGFKTTGGASIIGTLNFDGALFGIGNGSVSGSFAATDLIAGSTPSQLGRIFIYDGDGEDAQIATSNLSTSRTFTLPDASGTLALTSDIPAAGWGLGGNAGTTGSNFIGTTDATGLTFKTNGITRMSIAATGNVQLANTLTLGGDVNASGYSIAGAGTVGAQTVTITNQLNVANVGGHTMVGGLNMNANDIINVDELTADGIVTVGDELHIRRPSSSFYSSFEGSSTQSANIIYKLPDAQGTPGSTLQNDGAGNLTWGTHVHREVVNKGAVTISANGSQTVTFSITGAPANAAAYVSPENALPAGVIIAYARMSAADTVEIRLVNLTASNVTVGAENWSIGVIH